MMRTLLTSLGIALLSIQLLGAQNPTGRAIIENVKQQERSKDAYAEIEMKIIDSRGRERIRKLKNWIQYNADGTRKQMVKFTFPGDVSGTGFLSIEQKNREDDNWLFLPALRKTRRIAGSEKTDQFVGTDFTYEDLETEKPDQYSYKLLGEENMDGITSWKVESKPKTPERIANTAYGKRELWIDQQRDLLIRAHLYDKAGNLIKVLTTGNIQKVPGSEKWRPYEMTMENLEENSKTILNFSQYKIDQGISENYFTLRYLERPI